ncbi:MAG: TatD family nuclease-associated radical SAM protein [Candidatus Bathyarchaeota archaeon]|nr:TatD family nuclease-associated radical SAM protein [Candidatus Bathyarchaeota archaeon]
MDNGKNARSIVYRYGIRPNTIYLNITNRCSNSCIFCIKNYSSGLSGYKLKLDKEPTIDEIWKDFQDSIKDADKEVVWCGFGEPTIRLDVLLNISRRIRKNYSHLVIRLDTDGLAQLRNKNRKVVKELKDAGINSISISLNAENEMKYYDLCKPSIEGSYQAVLNFIKECKKIFSDIRLTIVDVDSIDISECKIIADKLGCTFKVRG